MANKRMFTMKIVDSDAFLDMPLSSQCLYFHLNMRADDDGFIGNPKRVMKIVGASEDDLKLLIAKRFLLVFENGVIVIKHWRMHNTLSKNRYHETAYTDEKSCLKLKDNNSYSLTSGNPIDDSGLIEMYKWRTNGEQAENKRLTAGEQMAVSDKDLGLGLDIDLDLEREKELDNTPPLSPSQGEREPEQGKPTKMTKKVIEEIISEFNISDYLLEQVRNWLDYKKERQFTYKERGLRILLKTVCENSRKYGDESVANIISQSISSGYQGITWDRIGRVGSHQNNGSNTSRQSQLDYLLNSIREDEENDGY